MTTIVEQLSAYAAALRYEDLPRGVVQSGEAAHHRHHRLRARRVCERARRRSRAISPDRSPARNLQPSCCSGQRSSPDLATFANGVMIRFLDFNDGYTSTGESGHPSDSIAAVLSAAEIMRRSGKDVIAATVLAYEVFCRICDEADLKPLGFDHVTVGGMASTAAAARPARSAAKRRLPRRSTSALRPTSRSIRRASATCRCGKAAPTPTRAATRCSRRCWRRAA